MSEIHQTADHLIVGRGRLVMDAPFREVVSGIGGKRVQVRTPDARALNAVGRRLVAATIPVRRQGSDCLVVEGATTGEIGDLAHALDIRIHELRSIEASLEEAYMALTTDSVEFAAGERLPVPGGGPQRRFRQRRARCPGWGT